jgi:hypothetical protein
MLGATLDKVRAAASAQTASRQPSLDPLGFSSTGQRNSFVEYVCWTSKVNRLARTLVPSKSDPIQIRLREGGQIRAFGKVLA